MYIPVMASQRAHSFPFLCETATIARLYASRQSGWRPTFHGHSTAAILPLWPDNICTLSHWCLLQNMLDFDDKPFHNVAKDEIKLSTDEKEKKVLQKTKEVYKPLTKWWRELLGKKSGVEAVKVSSRLSSTPCVVVASKCALAPDPSTFLPGSFHVSYKNPAFCSRLCLVHLTGVCSLSHCHKAERALDNVACHRAPVDDPRVGCSLRVSVTRLRERLCCRYGWSANMQRIMSAQALGAGQMQAVLAGHKTLEINPRHPLVVQLLQQVEANAEDPAAAETATLLFETALLESGYPVSNQQEFADKVSLATPPVKLAQDLFAVISECCVGLAQVCLPLITCLSTLAWTVWCAGALLMGSWLRR